MKWGRIFLASGILLVLLAACSTFVPTGDFIVTVTTKTPSNPYYKQGVTTTYEINGVEANELTLHYGTTYTFGINAPGHPFYLTTSDIGGPGFPGELPASAGVTGQETETGEMTYTPGVATASPIYYQCGVHDYMGWKIDLVP